MIKVAIVGNIASGKSEAEKILIDKGYKVFDTDKMAHEILESSSEILEAFKAYEILENGKISRKKLGKLVFETPELKQKLEAITHPLIKKRITEIFSRYNSEKYVFISIPLLFEANMQELFDKILFIYCDDEIRLKRLIKRNNFTKEEAEQRMYSQIAQDKKINKCNYIINNESTIENLKQEIDKLF